MPQFGKAIGSTLREFKSAAEHIDSDEVEEHPVNILNNSETNQTSSTLLEHFEELRRRLTNILISFLISLPLVYISSKWWITTFVYHIKRTQVVLHTFHSLK